MTVRIIECAQGSQEWLQARAGVITASMFSTVRAKVGMLDEKQQAYVSAILSGKSEAEARDVAGYKAAPKSDGVRRALAGESIGEWSDTAKNYAFRLAVERISGLPLDEGFQTWSMKRGHELEPEARMEHETQTGLIVQRAGFVVTDDGAFGASADGLINDDEGSEYKCFIDPEKLRSFWIDNDASGVMEQAQGCMWLTGRKRWHICLYCPALQPAGKQLWHKVFERDEEFIDAMERDLIEFNGLVNFYENKLRQESK